MRPRLWAPDWVRMRQLFAIGAPIALTITAEAGIFGAAAFLMGRFGAAELAGHTVALQLAALAFQAIAELKQEVDGLRAAGQALVSGGGANV